MPEKIIIEFVEVKSEPLAKDFERLFYLIDFLWQFLKYCIGGFQSRDTFHTWRSTLNDKADSVNGLS